MCKKAGCNYEGEDVRTPALPSCQSMPFIFFPPKTTLLIKFALLLYFTSVRSPNIIASLFLLIPKSHYVFKLLFVAPLSYKFY